MKKITIALPEEMIEEVHKLADKMGKQDFWTLAITWRQLIKKGLAYFDKDTGKKKKGSSKTKASEEPRDQKNNNENWDNVATPEDMAEATKNFEKEWNEFVNKVYAEDKK